MKKLEKTQGRLDQLHLSAPILAQWQHVVTSNKALNLLYQAMHAVLYRRSTAAIKMAIFCIFFVIVSFAVALAAAGAIRSK
jgi:hypothetical protein